MTTTGYRRRALILGALFATILAMLMARHIGDPWRFSNDDNGAWFSAVARAHREAGLAATRGQDFFLSRDTGALVPYLHHPPLPGLILAAAFGIVGDDGPRTARATFALLHLGTFGLLAALAARLWDPGREAGRYACALAVAAAVPMSAFYGKMPNHEVPGLLFFLLGVLVWGTGQEAPSGRRVGLACAAWALAAFSSWHAAFCVAGWVGVRADGRRRLWSLLALAASVALVVVHLLWAGGWSLHPSQTTSTRFWFAGSDGASLAERIGFLRHAFGIGVERYGYLPPLLALGWLLSLAVARARGRRAPDPLARPLLGLALGSVAYYLLFPRAVSYHAYQGFYLLPFVALASSAAVARLQDSRPVLARPRLRAWLPAAVVLLTCVLGVTATSVLYRKPSARVAEVVGSLQQQYR